MTDNQKFNDTELDALRECGNVGMGNAATSLSKLLDKQVDISLPETKFVPLQEIAGLVGGPESIVSGIFLPIAGDLKGQSMFIFSEVSALKIVDLMMGQEIGTAKKFGELEDSAVKEMANIFIGSYLSSIGDLTDLTLLPDVPHTATDMAQSVIDGAIQNIAKYSDNVLLVKESIKVEGLEIEGIFIVIFDQDSLGKLVKSLSAKYGVM